MRILSHFVAMYRSHRLGQQLGEIESMIRALPRHDRTRLGTLTLREIGQAARGEFPHLYGTSPEARYELWGQGTGIGYARARSGNPEITLRGIALWLAVAYHETKDSPHPGVQPLQRQLLRMLRELKELHGASDAAPSQWVETGAAA